MRGGIAAQLPLVGRRPDHLLVAGDHTAHRDVVVLEGPLSLPQCETHEVLVSREENRAHALLRNG